MIDTYISFVSTSEIIIARGFHRDRNTSIIVFMYYAQYMNVSYVTRRFSRYVFFFYSYISRLSFAHCFLQIRILNSFSRIMQPANTHNTSLTTTYPNAQGRSETYHRVHSNGITLFRKQPSKIRKLIKIDFHIHTNTKST